MHKLEALLNKKILFTANGQIFLTQKFITRKLKKFKELVKTKSL